MLYLLEAGIKADFTNMEFGNLALIVGFFAVFLILAFVSGVTLKSGDKELALFGIRKLLAKKDDDEEIKDRLKKETDNIDEEMKADLYDLNERISDKAREIYQGICYFPAERMAAIILSVLDKRVARNKMTEKLQTGRRTSYIQDIKREIKEKYIFFYEMSRHTKCNDEYPHPDKVMDDLFALVDEWNNTARLEIMVPRKIEKINLYKVNEKEFKVKKYLKWFCLDKIQNNTAYIRELGGIYEEKKA